MTISIKKMAYNMAPKGSKREMATFVDDLLNAVAGQLNWGNSVALPGVGTLKVVERKGRQGRNPKTGEKMDIPSRRVVKFSRYKGEDEVV